MNRDTLKQIMIDQKESYLNNPLIPRKYFLEENVNYCFVGIRRTGKSYMMYQKIQSLIEKGVPVSQIVYVNFEDERLLEITSDDLNIILEIGIELSGTANRPYLFFDEIQRIEGWQRLVNAYFSLDNFDVYVTGSNSKLLSGEFATYLTGRYINIKIFPFSFVEYLEYNKDSNLSKKELFMDYLTFGGFPASFELDNKIQYLNDLFDSIVFNDIIKRFDIKNVDLLIRLTHFLVSNIGQLVSANSIVKYLKKDRINVSVNTVYNYISYLEEACLIYKVKREDLIGKKILNHLEKYYVVDLGFRESILKKDLDIGQSLENIVYFELLRRGYEVNIGKYNTKEIDFICRKGSEKIYIQVTYILANEEIHKREFDPLLKVNDNYPKYVLSLDDFDMSYMGVKHLNIINFLTGNEI